VNRQTFDRVIMFIIFLLYVVLFEAWLIIAPDPSWGGVELIFMMIPVLTMVILYSLPVGFATGIFLIVLYVPVIWPQVAAGLISPVELLMKFILMGALGIGAAIYKNYEEKRRERIKKLATRLQNKVEQQGDIIKAQQALGENLELSAQLDSFLHWSIHLVSASAGYIAVYDKDRRKVVHARSGEENGQDLPEPFSVLLEGGGVDIDQADIDTFVDEMAKHAHSICVPLKIRNENLGALCLTPSERRHFSDEDTELISMLGVKAAIAIENAKLHDLNTQLFVDSIRALAKIINTRDPLTKDHSNRVAHIAGRVARHIGLRGRELSNVVLAADLHDIGRIIVPDEILRKPGKLTKSEYEVVKQHPAAGYDLLQGVRALKDVLPGIRYHHERFDGLGYPDGLAGSDIPLIARIISVADVFEALTSPRSHRGAVSEKDAAKVLLEVAGSQLDPELVDAFIKTYKLAENEVK
jgi:HD-GYP domain-containing protein (c-di-GMP phosphodiesterase class II)